jgi:type IV pilus assembly protein PilV
MNTHFQQKGVGLMEVLVALLVLALGVLGFVALQYRAVEASSEGEYRIQAINLARDVAEKIRVNRTAQGTYVDTIADTTITALPTTNCFDNFCTPTQKAEFDGALVKLSAERMGMTLNMLTCPGVSNSRQCVYVAWGDTAATADGEDIDCTTDTGTYTPNSTCVVMEVY